MASRNANINLLIRSGAFQAGIRRLVSQVQVAGVKMGKALSGPMSAGLGAARKSLSGFGSDVKGHIKTAATLGGAFAVGSFVKDAVKLESMMKDLAFTLEIMTGKAANWRDIQTKIQKVADDTSNKTEDVANAFKTVAEATKDPAFAFEVLRTMGVHATGTSADLGNVASVVQMLRRQVGVTAEEVPDLLAAITELSKQGGPSFEDLARVGDKLASVMQQIGLSGADSFKQMIGIMNAADATMAGVDKQVVGLQMSLQKLTEESVLKRIAKDVKIPERDLLETQNAFDALKKILSTGEKGILRLGQEFIGPEADKISKVFSKPFITAYRAAKEEGLKEKSAVQMGLKALDDSFYAWSQTSLTHADISKESAKRQEDADRRFAAAIDKMKQAFTRPEMTNAIDKLSEVLPKVADGFVKLLDFVVNNPLLSAGGFVGAKVAIPAATSFAGAGVMSLFKAGATKLASGAGVLTNSAMLLGKAGGVLGAAGAGYAVGTFAYEKAVEPELKGSFDKLDKAADSLSTASSALAGSDLSKKMAALKEVETQIKTIKEGPGIIAEVTGGLASIFTDVKSAGEQYKDKERQLLRVQSQLIKSISSISKSMDTVSNSANSAGNNLTKVGKAAGNSSVRGPKTDLTKQPGSTGVRG